MGNGRPHDHPISDILNHGIPTFSDAADELIRQIAAIVTPQRIDEFVNWQNPPPISEFEEELATTLQTLRENTTEQ